MELALQQEKIPEALANDNYVGYIHEYFLAQKVTWIEAVIACPVFTCLVTYYVEGPKHERHHLMEDVVAAPQRSYGVRGNLFSFLLPWEVIHNKLHDTMVAGNLHQWPLSPDTVEQLVRVQILKSPTGIADKFRELRVRPWVVRSIAMLYIKHRVHDLASRPGVLKIHEERGQLTVLESLRQHIDERVNSLYLRPRAQR